VVSGLFVFTSPLARALDLTVPNTFVPGTPAVAGDINTNFSATATAVNSKQNRVNGTCPAGQAIQSVLANGTVTCETVPFGALMNVVSGNNGSIAANTTGYVNIVSNFTPAFDATALVMTRCSGSAGSAGTTFSHRVAIRSPATSGGVTIGTQFYHFPQTPAANIIIMNTNNDTFLLTAGATYDFGVNIIDSLAIDICSAVVTVFRR
jgi:hypothetical protein